MGLKNNKRGGATLLARNCKEFDNIDILTYNSSMMNYKFKKGFTLAEVLITLAIVGIVAAITIPTLVSNYQKKVLKNQLINKYALLQQQMLYAKNDYGVSLKKYCTTWDYDNGKYKNRDECLTIFNQYFKVIGTCEYKNKPRTYDLKKEAYIDVGGSAKPKYLLADGTCYETTINSGRLGFSFDMNGPDKGPNALGHDIFAFWVDDKDYLEPIKMTGYYTDDELASAMENCEGNTSIPSSNGCIAGNEQNGRPCTKNSSQKGNGLGCSWYALNDVCPDDETKGYWDCLPK